MTSPTVATTLELAHGIRPAELDAMVAILGRLDDRMRSFKDGTVTLNLGIKERGTPSQRTVLEARVAGMPTLVATSEITDFHAAVAEVRDDMVRQMTDATGRREPRNNRTLRAT